MKVECSVSLRRIEGQQLNCFALWTVAPFRIRVIFGQAPLARGQDLVLVVEAISFIIHVAMNLRPFMMMICRRGWQGRGNFPLARAWL